MHLTAYHALAFTNKPLLAPSAEDLSLAHYPAPAQGFNLQLKKNSLNPAKAQNIQMSAQYTPPYQPKGKPKIEPLMARVYPEMQPEANAAYLKTFSEKLAQYYENQLPDALLQIQELLGSYGTVKGRAKSAPSIFNKLLRRQKYPPLSYMQRTLPLIPDGIGTRLVMWQGNQAEVESVVQALSDAIQKGQLSVKVIHNYRGVNELAYLSPDHIQTLLRAIKSSRRGHQLVGISDGPDAVKPSGYTAAQLKIQYRNGANGELQLRGSVVDQVAGIEHWLYCLRQGKATSSTNPFKCNQQLARLEKIVKNLSKQEYDDYLTYLSHQYQKARQLERGEPVSVKPELPKSLYPYPELHLANLTRYLDEKVAPAD